MQIGAVQRGVGTRVQEPVHRLLFQKIRPVKRLRGQVKQGEADEEHVRCGQRSRPEVVQSVLERVGVLQLRIAWCVVRRVLGATRRIKKLDAHPRLESVIQLDLEIVLDDAPEIHIPVAEQMGIDVVVHAVAEFGGEVASQHRILLIERHLVAALR